MIRCCKDCVAPKRHPGCHDHCPEYQAEKQKYKQQIDKKKKEDYILAGVVEQHINLLYRFKKRRGK